MAAPMTRQYGHGNARDFAFPERRGRLAPYRAGKCVPRVGKNVQVVEAAAADDAYFDAHDQSFVMFREKNEVEGGGDAFTVRENTFVMPGRYKDSFGRRKLFRDQACHFAGKGRGFRRRRIPESGKPSASRDVKRNGLWMWMTQRALLAAP